MDYCPNCLYPFELGDDDRQQCKCNEPCPCCGNDPRQNCVYDTATQRHLKNLMNGLPDEEWVTEKLKLQLTLPKAAR